MDSKKYNELDPSIHLISRHMKLDEDERKNANERLSHLLERHLLPAMKEVDDDFKSLYKRLHYSGSYYENLRVLKPNEFDLNLELRSQKGSQKFFQIHYTGKYPGYVNISSCSDIFKKWVNGSGFVMQNKVLCWLQGVVDKALLKIPDGLWIKVWRKMSGPAVTLFVEYGLGEIFSVDLVPVFVMDSSQWPKTPVRQQVIKNDSYAEQWCVVPKPNNHIDQYGNAATSWRMSFYNQEKIILNDKKHLKNALKLMKLLRDEEGWHCLSSYYLKTVYLWAVIETDRPFWNAGIGRLFMNMLITLKNYLKHKKSIPFFWDEQLNLLSSVKEGEIVKIGNRLDRIIKEIDRNLENGKPKNIENLFPSFIRSREAPNENPLPRTETSSSTQQNNLGVMAAIVAGVGAVAITGAVLFRSLWNTRD